MNLLEQLAAGERHDAEYEGALSNHLPMALVALHRLGADAARLAAFEQRYATRLGSAPPAEPWPAGDAWTGRLGEPRAWPVYRSLMREWLAVDGAAGLLEQVLPVLLRGAGSAAFHGLIRSAYAVQAAPAGELADALAYWACRYVALPAVARIGHGREADPARVLDALPNARAPGRLIIDQMRWAALHTDHAARAARLRIDDGTLERLARHAAAVYIATGSFTVLHLVTGCHAARVLIGFVDADARPAAVAHLWSAYAAGVLTGGLRELAPIDAWPWDTIVPRAIASDDEHVIKLVDSCREQERAYGGEEWRHAATRAVAQA